MAGPRRRAAVARTVNAARGDAAVRVVPGGWTVSGRTGRVVVARTLDALLAAGAPTPELATVRAAALAAADAVGAS